MGDIIKWKNINIILRKKKKRLLIPKSKINIIWKLKT